jgi:hypothetical protein
VHGHGRPERRDAFGKLLARLLAQPGDPLAQYRPRGLVEPSHLVVGERLTQLHRGQARAVQDLVGVRVANPAEDARVGQHALEGVVLGREGGPERRRVRVEHLEPAGVVSAERRLAAHHVERGPLLGAGLGHDQRARREIECRQPDPARRLCARRLPVQPPGDHQMDDDKQLLLERDDQPLPEPTKADDRLAAHGAHRRIDRSQQERREQPHPLQARPHNARRQSL